MTVWSILKLNKSVFDLEYYPDENEDGFPDEESPKKVNGITVWSQGIGNGVYEFEKKDPVATE